MDTLAINNPKMKSTIPFIIAPKIIKYLVINITKQVQDLYIENYQTLLREFKEELGGKTFHAEGLEDFPLRWQYSLH